MKNLKVSSDKNQHICEACGKSFKYKSQLIAHERTHSKEKPFKCDDCDRSFTQKGHLTM